MSGPVTPTTTTPTTPTTPTTTVAPNITGASGVAGTPDGISSMAPSQSSGFKGRLEKWSQGTCCCGICAKIASWLLKCFYGNTTPAPTPPTPVPVPPVNKDETLRDEILAVFQSGAPNDTTITEKVGKFNTISDLSVKLTVVQGLQGNAHSTPAHVAKFIDALTNDQKDQLRQLIWAAQTPVDRALRDGVAVMNNDPKCNFAIQAMTAYKAKLLTDARNQKKELILNNFKDGFPNTVQRTMAADGFKAVDNRTKLEVIKGIMASRQVNDVIVGEFVNLLPDGLKNDFFARILNQLEIVRAQEQLNYHNAVGDAILAGTPVPDQPNWPALPTGQDYFTANSRVDMVRNVLDDLITATPVAP